MKKRTILACLDIDNRRVVKGKKFEDVKELADPVELARKYEAEGADELVFYDISASVDRRGMFMDLIRTIADELTIPFIVGGGIQTLSDAELAFEAGADRVSVNSGALRDPELLRRISERYGAEKLLLSMDVSRSSEGQWNVYAKAGREDTGQDALEWAAEGERLGAGGLVVNCIDEDGMQNGYNLELTEKIAQSVSIPVIASGGAGRPQHITELFERTSAQGALAASILHYGQVTLQELQEAKRSAGSSAVKWDENGLVPAILQDAQTKDVLTLAYMNDEALEKTIKTKETWLFSRSRQELWHKGKTSGNRQTVREIRYDCDRDAVLLLVDPMGPACHTGSASCFSGEAPGAKSQAETVLQDLADRIAARQAAPADGSYTSYLFREGLDKILKKVGEEATEVVIGAKNGNLNETANEIADLAYHVLVLMAELGLPAKNVTDILKGRKTEKE